MSVPGKRFPNESNEYRAARDELLQAEIDLRARIERVAALRRRLPQGGEPREDYVFERAADDGSTKPVKLSELFEPEHRSLFVYNFMYGPDAAEPCPMCTSFIDGLNATAPHVTQRVSMAIVAKSPIERIMEVARSRGWGNLALVSSGKNGYNADYFGEDAQRSQWPMANVFTRADGGIRHFWGSEMFYAPLDGQPRHVDQLWPLWTLFDLTPEGRGTDWYPQAVYR